ncbi:MAG: lysophospholipid acyltransferase family protein [Hyphomicrobiales bacterium]
MGDAGTTSSSVREKAADEIVAARSARVLGLFNVWLERYFRRKFTSVRVLKNTVPAVDPGRSLVVFGNHPAWWDPLTFILLSNRLFPQYRSFGPMDARMLEKYRFMRKLGVFGVEQETMRGAAQFLLVSRGLLSDPANALWLTPQGHFSDARVRPVTFRAGLGHTARDVEATFVPIAMELVFWNEPSPELLVAFGAPIVSTGDDKPEAWTQRFEAALEATMDRLAQASMARDPALFDALLTGDGGVSLAYDVFRRLKALAQGKPYRPAHGDQ